MLELKPVHEVFQYQCTEPRVELVLTTEAESLRRRRVWQVNVSTMAMVDTMGASAELPL